MTQLFADTDVLFRFTPTEEEREQADLTWGPADEYVVTVTGAWGLYQTGHWRLLACSPRPIIARLLTDRATLAAKLAVAEGEIERLKEKEGDIG